MQQTIRYKGISLTPDELAAENGALSFCGNLELHDGALRPSFVSGTKLQNKIKVESEGDTTLIYIHETGSYKHFVGLHQEASSDEAKPSYSLHWFNLLGNHVSLIHTFDAGVTVRSLSSIGNTLVIITSDGIYYALWSDDDYDFLGKKPPFIDIAFTISAGDEAEDYDMGGVDGDGSKAGFKETFQQTTIASADAFSLVKGTVWNNGDICANVKETKQSDITQSVYALVNRTNNLIARKGRFYANFFVRYCYRMFDGSMIMHSAPVFMPVLVPNNYVVSSMNVNHHGSEPNGNNLYLQDKVTFGRNDAKGVKFEVRIDRAAFCYKPRNVALMYQVKSEVDELKKWNDIIKSVDIFITPPVTNIDTSEKISSLKIYDENFGLNQNLFVGPTWGTSDDGIVGHVYVNFPTFSDDAYKNKLKNTSAFYKISSLKVSELSKGGLLYLEVDKASIYQVSLQEQMKDDYKTHNLIFANGGYAYNHRLNLYGIQEKLFSGFNRNTMFPAGYSIYSHESQKDYLVITKIVTVLNTDSGKKYVECKFSSDVTEVVTPYMLANLIKFYPDSRAEKMVVFTKNSVDDTPRIFSFELEPCNELNGAMHMGDFKASADSYIVSSFSYTVDDVVDLGNKIYTSEADNAFYFPLNGINTVGIGNILGIASTTRALSQGQFGQYPLMAFSTDGIWALNVSASGTYSSIHPISREVCSNPLSITQLDQSVAFVTNRSLSRVAESQVASMSDVLDGPTFDVNNQLGQFAEFLKGNKTDTQETLTVKEDVRLLLAFSESPIDFFQHCKIIYDYKNERILCLDVSQVGKQYDSNTVAFAYSIRDQAWSTFLIKNVLTTLNSYPSPYIQYRDGTVECLDQSYDYGDLTLYHGVLVTRTLKTDEDGLQNAITGFLHNLTGGTVLMWIFGSNDNQNWHYCGRCSGYKANYMSCKSYRYFRLCLIIQMKSRHQYLETKLNVIRRFNKF